MIAALPLVLVCALASIAGVILAEHEHRKKHPINKRHQAEEDRLTLRASCEVCAAAGLLPSRAIACYCHSTLAIQELEGDRLTLRHALHQLQEENQKLKEDLSRVVKGTLSDRLDLPQPRAGDK